MSVNDEPMLLMVRVESVESSAYVVLEMNLVYEKENEEAGGDKLEWNGELLRASSIPSLNQMTDGLKVESSREQLKSVWFPACTIGPDVFLTANVFINDYYIYFCSV